MKLCLCEMASARPQRERRMIGTSYWNLARTKTFPHITGLLGAIFTMHSKDRRCRNAHRAGCAADGGGSTQTVRRHGAGGLLADGRTGRARTRRYALCERRLVHLSEAGRDLAKGPATGRLGTRSL